MIALAKRATSGPTRTGATMDALTDQNSKSGAKRLVTSWLHPRVYMLLTGLALWFVVWVWSFIGPGETDYLLFIVSGFIALVVTLQLVLSRVRQMPESVTGDTVLDSDKPHSFREWARGYFDIEHGRLRSADATILILLPIASAAIGMMAFGIEFQIVEHLASSK